MPNEMRERIADILIPWCGGMNEDIADQILALTEQASAQENLGVALPTKYAVCPDCHIFKPQAEPDRVGYCDDPIEFPRNGASIRVSDKPILGKEKE
jgi:hypothetical protein